jgi:hypothetical protein
MTKTVQNSFVELLDSVAALEMAYGVEFRCIATSEYPREEICVRYRDWPGHFHGNMQPTEPRSMASLAIQWADMQVRQ